MSVGTVGDISVGSCGSPGFPHQTDFLDLHGRLWLDTSEDYVFASKLHQAPLSRLAPVAAHHGLTAGPPARTRSALPVPRPPNAAACSRRPKPNPRPRPPAFGIVWEVGGNASGW